MQITLDAFDERMHEAQNADHRLKQLAELTIAVELLGNAVKALDDRLDGIESWLESFAKQG